MKLRKILEDLKLNVTYVTCMLCYAVNINLAIDEMSFELIAERRKYMIKKLGDDYLEDMDLIRKIEIKRLDRVLNKWKKEGTCSEDYMVEDFEEDFMETWVYD